MKQILLLTGPMKKEMLESALPQSPDTLSEVTVGNSTGTSEIATDVLLTGSTLSDKEKKAQDQLEGGNKEKRKGMLTGEAYSRAVDRYILK